jgi:glucose/arabinose dehydrogenase
LDADGGVTAPADGVLPTELRCTGLYGDWENRRPACGVLEYKPAYELWSDAAVKRRFVSLPSATSVDATDPDAFVYPVGTQFWKEFRVPDGQGGTRLGETRLLRKVSAGWLYTSYVWNEDGTTAIQENNGVADLFGLGHTVPTRMQCQECHKGRQDFILGWDLIMLGEGATGLTRDSLVNMGLLTTTAGPIPSAEIPGNDVEVAALGYMHANCGVSCHNPNVRADGGRSGMRLRLNVGQLGSVQATDAFTTAINHIPDVNRSPIPANPASGPFLDIRPLDTERSLALARMKIRGEGQMPRIGTNHVDETGMTIVATWISSMTPANGYPAPSDGGGTGGTNGGTTGGTTGTTTGGTTGGTTGSTTGGTAGGTTGSTTGGTTGSTTGGTGGTTGSTTGGTTGGTTTGGTTTGGSTGGTTGGSTTGGSTGGTTGGTTGCRATTAPAVGKLGLETVASDASLLAKVSNAAQPPGSSDWYLVRQSGQIMVRSGGTLNSTPFLDLSAEAPLTTEEEERGLMALAFAPDYAASGKFYVAITPTTGANAGVDYIREYKRSSANPLVADPSTRKDLLVTGMSDTNHNGGTLVFGPDGFLYAGLGDGGGSCSGNQGNVSQNINRYYGKILRMDPTAAPPYAAAGNPFVPEADPDGDGTSYATLVWHYGLRNPFRFSFDPANGDLYIGDVGQSDYEEIDFAAAGTSGLNFGWPYYEGMELLSTTCGANTYQMRPGSTHSPAVTIIDRGDPAPRTAKFGDYSAIMGGIVYRGSGIPALNGAYIFGDYTAPYVGAFYRCNGQSSPIAAINKNCDPNLSEACFSPKSGAGLSQLTAIVRGNDGEMYFVGNRDTLYKVVPN